MIAPPINILDAFDSPAPTLDYVFDGLLSGTVGGLVAPGGAGKSYLLLAICVYVATGHDPTGGALPPIGGTGKVTYLPAEDPPEVIKLRLHYLGRYLPPDIRALAAERLAIYPLLGTIPDLLKGSWLDGILRAAEGKRLLAIDTLRRFHSEDENDNGDMARVIQRIETIPARTDCTVLFAHHTGKGGADRNDQHSSRGASAITDNVRWQANLMTMTQAEAAKMKIEELARRDFVKFFTTKSNYGQHAECWLRRGEGGVLVKAHISEIPTTPAAKNSQDKKEKAYDETDF